MSLHTQKCMIYERNLTTEKSYELHIFIFQASVVNKKLLMKVHHPTTFPHKHWRHDLETSPVLSKNNVSLFTARNKNNGAISRHVS